MTTTNQINEKGFSKDYGRLCELIKTQAVIVVVDDHNKRFATNCGMAGKCFRIDGFCATLFKKTFIQECHRLNLSYVIPKED